jgi:hypothetical protein
LLRQAFEEAIHTHAFHYLTQVAPYSDNRISSRSEGRLKPSSGSGGHDGRYHSCHSLHLRGVS